MTTPYDAKPADGEWFIPEESRQQLTEHFEKLPNTVEIHVFTAKDDDTPFNEYTHKFVGDLGKLSEKVTARFLDMNSDEAKTAGIDLSPTILIAPDRYNIRFRGAPMGEEGRSFVTSIVLAGMGQSGLSPQSRQVLQELDEKRDVLVFVNPSCPYCPGQVVNAVKCAIELPDRVSAHCVETGENQELSMQFNVGSVPHTVINETHEILGYVPEERFVVELLTMQDATQLAEELAQEQGIHPGSGQDATVAVDLVVIGAGPAGLTAGIYAERAGLRTIVLEKAVVGGQVTLTPVVENYPGFTTVPGKQLMDIMSEHAREYVTIMEGEEVSEIKIGKNIEVFTNRGAYVADGLILATGASYRSLGAPGEQQYFGKGVNYCATCDGYLFKNKKVAIVGGGNTALTDALHLKNLGVDVTVIHRRDEFRAQKHLKDSVEQEGIHVLWNTVVEEIKGDDRHVSGLSLRNVKDDSVMDLPVDGLFVAIGQDVNTELAQMIGLTLNDKGFVRVDADMRTNIPRIYAAGDIVGGVQQIVTAIGEGSVAAMSAFEDMSHPYWKK